MKKFLKWMSLSLILVIIIVFFSGYWFVHKSISPTFGTFEEKSLKNSATIYRDEWGIPHIYANSLNDVFFAQGYAQAQDRLFELDLSRRAVRGELSQIFGKDLIDADKFFISIGFYRAAEKGEKILAPQSKKYLQSYADGVNAFIDEHKNNLPPEFTLLGYKPTTWKVTDSLAIGKYMSWTLGGNMQTELLLMAISEKLDENKVKEIFPSYPKDGITIIKNAWREAGVSYPKAEKLLALTDLSDRDRIGVPGIGIGSNNWVVSGSMTKSGKPILANDMHLEIKSPSIWYQNHLKVPGVMNITGVIFPGIPGVIVGHNDYIAWGVTNLNPDVQDLYIEKRNPDNPYQFEYNGKWEDAKVVKYDIKVKGEKDVPYTVAITRHGPIISDVFDQPDTIPLALKWTNLMPTSELDAVIQIDQAKDWDSFKKGLENFKVPAQNFVYADIYGNIAYRGNGLIPIRSKGDGLLPVPGWNDQYEWKGFIPYDQLPTVMNPKQGFLATANNKVVDNSYPYFLSYEWAPPYRATSITESLKGRKNLTLQDVISIQTNWNNLQARKLAPILEIALKSVNFDNLNEKVKEQFFAWLDNNPKDEPTEAGPMIYHTLYLHLLENTFKDELDDELFTKFITHGNAINTMDKFLVNDSTWFDNVTTNEKENRDQIIIQSFKDTVIELKDKLGGNIDAWKWGTLHTITFDHPLGKQKGLDIIFNDGPYSYGGSAVTVGAASYPLANPYQVTSAGPWRYGVDLADMNHGMDILFGGSSGHPFSEHYDDQIQKWLHGEYKPMWFSDDDIKKAAKDNVMIINP